MMSWRTTTSPHDAQDLPVQQQQPPWNDAAPASCRHEDEDDDQADAGQPEQPHQSSSSSASSSLTILDPLAPPPPHGSWLTHATAPSLARGAAAGAPPDDPTQYDENHKSNDDDDDDDDVTGSLPRAPADTSRRHRDHWHEPPEPARSHPNDHHHHDDDDDDEGADHAIMDVPVASTVSWKPQNVQSTCEFTHVIMDYASKRDSGCKKAEYSDITVDEHGNKWRLIIYVNGNGRASNHHLSLFLQVADAEDLPFGWKKAVSYVLTLEHPNNPALSYAKRNPDKTFKLCPKAIDWGWSQFITSDRIQQEGFVEHDSLTVRASVTVKSSSVSIDEEDAELYLKCAVEEGDAAAVKLCLEQGASVNCQFKDDLYTPLHTACSSNATNKMGSMEVLKLLLEEGADGNACNKWRETPLLIAANNGHLEAVEALLKHHADPSLCSEAGWSALTFAAHKVGRRGVGESLVCMGEWSMFSRPLDLLVGWLLACLIA